VRAGFSVLGVGGMGAAAVVLALPRLSSHGRFVRFRVVRWLAPRATPLPEATRASGLVLASWLIRAVAVFLLLATFGIAVSLPRPRRAHLPPFAVGASPAAARPSCPGA
jgi:hypothetical protein